MAENKMISNNANKPTEEHKSGPTRDRGVKPQPNTTSSTPTTTQQPSPNKPAANPPTKSS